MKTTSSSENDTTRTPSSGFVSFDSARSIRGRRYSGRISSEYSSVDTNMLGMDLLTTAAAAAALSAPATSRRRNSHTVDTGLRRQSFSTVQVSRRPSVTRRPSVVRRLSLPEQISAEFESSIQSGGAGALSSSDQSSIFAPISATTPQSQSIRDATIDMTVNKLQFQRLGICGREDEILKLEAIVRSMVPNDDVVVEATNEMESSSFNGLESNNKQKQLVLLSGYPGVGKSSLIAGSPLKALIKEELGGSLAMGKFEQCFGGAAGGVSGSGNQQRPFGAFRTLCEQLVSDMEELSIPSPNFFQERMRRTDASSATSSSQYDIMIERIQSELREDLPELLATFPALDEILNIHQQQQQQQQRGIHNQRANIYRGDSYRDRHFGSGTNFSQDIQDEEELYDPAFDGAKTHCRINFAFRNLIRIVSTFLSPLVLVIDDLQWADAASLDLLEELITDHDNTNTMIVGIYRSNEVNETHHLSKMIRQVRDTETSGGEGKLNITEIEMRNLDVPAVIEMLQTLLEMDKEQRVWPLAELCHKKTDGNPFYLIHFVTMLYDVHLLEYNLGLMRWKWDIEEIEDATTATQNVVDVLNQTMKRLSDENQRLLQYASHLGSVFDRRSIFVLWRDLLQKKPRHIEDSGCSPSNGNHMANNSGSNDHPSSDEYVSKRLDHIIQSCVKGGFLEVVVEGTYRWVHDKLQEAAMDLVPTDNRSEFGQHVAEVLGSQLTDAELEASIFIVVDHFNEGEPPVDPSKQLKLAELNLRAANKAVWYSAFESAASYCKYGIEMLPTDCWEKHYELSLELYSLGAETEGFMGNHPVIELYCQEVLRQRRFVETRQKSSSALTALSDKFRVYNVMMNNMCSRKLYHEAKDLCLDVLKNYGTTFPKRKVDISLRLFFNIFKIKYIKKPPSEDEVENLPMMTDPALVEQMGLVDKLASFCYTIQSPLMPLVIFKALNWTLRYGLSKFSPPAFATTGVILAGILGDLNGAATYAKYAMMLLAKLDPCASRAVDSRTRYLVHSMVLHWTQPARSMLKRLLRGYEIGMLSGDTQSACLCIYGYIAHSLISGRDLVALEHDCCVYCAQIGQLSEPAISNNCRISWQVVLNLIGRGEHRSRLVGEALPEDVREQESEASAIFVNIFNVQQSILCSYFGDHECGAVLAMERGNSFQTSNPGSPWSGADVFHRCLSLLATLRKAKEGTDGGSDLSRSQKGKYMKSAKQSLSRIKKWVEQDNPNARHYEALLDAELAAYEDRSSIAKKFYETAAYFAGRGGFLNDSALINERYSEYLLHCSCTEQAEVSASTEFGIIDASKACNEEAKFRLKESIKYYREWGAVAKAELLEQKYESLLATVSPAPMTFYDH